MTEARAGRRPLMFGLVGGAAVLGATSIAARLGSTDGTGAPGTPALQLSAESPDMSSLTVSLDRRVLTRRTATSWSSPILTTSTHSMVGVAWTGTAEPRTRIRSRVDGRWTGWRGLPVMHDGPDAGASEDAGVRGTQLVWTGDSDGIQVRVEGARPADLTLVLLHPGRLAGDAGAVATGPGADSLARATTERTAAGKVPRPDLFTRDDWGADERRRERPPQYNTTIQQVHVHHTASGNDYAADDVPGIIRGFYRYHTGTLGWSDIGYNFLVDRFGRAWIGRAGGSRRPVRGAHTLGFNATSVGIAVIGNFETARPSRKVLHTLAAIAAWKLHPYGRNPTGTVRVGSEGSDKYRSGTVVRLPVIDGHRDTNDTACPGGNLYDRLASIRRRTQRIIARAEAPPAVTLKEPSVVTGTPFVGQALTVDLGEFSPAGTTSSYQWRRGAKAIVGATAATYQLAGEDLGALIGVQVTTSKAGCTSLVEDLDVPGRVRATTTVGAHARPLVRRAAVHVHVTADGADVVPTGSVTVTVRGRQRQVALEDGRAVARFEDLPAGQAVAEVSYPGDGLLDASQVSLDLVVRRRRG